MRKLNGSSWTTKQLLQFGQGLKNGYGPGNVSEYANPDSNEWTAEKLAQFGKHMSRAYLP